jgi:hypothetical protein
MEDNESQGGVDFVKKYPTEIICKCPGCGRKFVVEIVPPEPEEDDR